MRLDLAFRKFRDGIALLESSVDQLLIIIGSTCGFSIEVVFRMRGIFVDLTVNEVLHFAFIFLEQGDAVVFGMPLQKDQAELIGADGEMDTAIFAVDEDFVEIERLAEAMGERISNTRQSLLLSDVVREREDLQGMSGSPHLSTGVVPEEVDEEQDGETPGEGDVMERFIKRVNDDAYVRESMAILADLSAMQTEVASKEK